MPEVATCVVDCSSFISETAGGEENNSHCICMSSLADNALIICKKSAGKLETVEGFHLLKQMKETALTESGQLPGQILIASLSPLQLRIPSLAVAAVAVAD